MARFLNAIPFRFLSSCNRHKSVLWVLFHKTAGRLVDIVQLARASFALQLHSGKTVEIMHLLNSVNQFVYYVFIVKQCGPSVVFWAYKSDY